MIKIGDKGDAVKRLQKQLNAWNMSTPLTVDGIFGEITENRVVHFQRFCDLMPDGIVGPKTQAALNLYAPVDLPEGQVKITGMDSDEGTPAWYRRAWRQCQIDSGFQDEVAADAKIILKGLTRYARVEGMTKVPWYVIALMHFNEASCDFDGCLANGQRVIGPEAMKQNKKTTIVPKGRGPYPDWETSAVDAIKLQGLDKVTNWEIGNQLYLVERFNGTGYISGAGKAETSPYLWARTTINDGQGKYTSDGKFTSTAPTNNTSGYCAILKWLEANHYMNLKVDA